MMNEYNHDITLSAGIRYNADLTSSEKIMYGELKALANESGLCEIDNEELAELFGVHEQTIGLWIKGLDEKRYIWVKRVREEDDRRKKKRKIYI